MIETRIGAALVGATLFVAAAEPAWAQGDAFPSVVTIGVDSSTVDIFGTLVDSESNQPIAGTQVALGLHGALSNLSGEFRLSLPLGTEVTDLEFRHIGFRSITMSLRAVGSREFYMNGLDLRDCERFGLPSDTREGRVRILLHDRSSGAPIDAQVWLWLRSLNSVEPAVSVHTVTDGVLRLPDVQSGVYHLRLEAIEYEPWTMDVLRLRHDACFGVQELELSAALRANRLR